MNCRDDLRADSGSVHSFGNASGAHSCADSAAFTRWGVVCENYALGFPNLLSPWLTVGIAVPCNTRQDYGLAWISGVFDRPGSYFSIAVRGPGPSVPCCCHLVVTCRRHFQLSTLLPPFTVSNSIT